MNRRRLLEIGGLKPLIGRILALAFLGLMVTGMQAAAITLTLMMMIQMAAAMHCQGRVVWIPAIRLSRLQ